MEEAIPEAGASRSSVAGGTQKLELLGVLMLERVQKLELLETLDLGRPEAGASGDFSSGAIQKLELLEDSSAGETQKLELLVLGTSRSWSFWRCSFWRL